MTRAEALEISTDGPPVEGSVDLDVPVADLWDCFNKPHLWPAWNPCMRWVRNRSLVRGSTLVWVFEPIRSSYMYRLPATARIVEVEPEARATWEVVALPGFFARHTYFMEDLGDSRSRFGSWEKAMGPTFRMTSRFWMAHFQFVCDRSLEGARRLEQAFLEHGRLDDELVSSLSAPHRSRR
ncbi:MAG: SRPBCC family protein [Acidimicrobiales bacterium]